jgi:hypothetical protein
MRKTILALLFLAVCTSGCFLGEEHVHSWHTHKKVGDTKICDCGFHLVDGKWISNSAFEKLDK